MVCGLGYGVMGGLFAITNILADSRGPGAPGLPDHLKTDPTPLPMKHVPYYFATVSSECPIPPITQLQASPSASWSCTRCAGR